MLTKERIEELRFMVDIGEACREFKWEPSYKRESIYMMVLPPWVRELLERVAQKYGSVDWSYSINPYEKGGELIGVYVNLVGFFTDEDDMPGEEYSQTIDGFELRLDSLEKDVEALKEAAA